MAAVPVVMRAAVFAGEGRLEMPVCVAILGSGIV